MISSPASQNTTNLQIQELLASQKKIMKSINHLSKLVYKLIDKEQLNAKSARDDFLEKENMVVFPNMNETAVDIVYELLPSAVLHDVDKQDFTHEELAAIKLRTSGQTAFAGMLFRKLFSLEEMKGRNCRGVGSKERLDEKKFNKFKCVYLNIILRLRLN